MTKENHKALPLADIEAEIGKDPSWPKIKPEALAQSLPTTGNTLQTGDDLSDKERSRLEATISKMKNTPPKFNLVEKNGINAVVAPDLDKGADALEFYCKLVEATGVTDRALQSDLISQAAAVWKAQNKGAAHQTNYTVALMHDINPQNALEGMLTVQMVGAHNLAIEMMKRAVIPEQTVDGVDRNINRATKLLRTFTAQIEALQRLRGKGQQTMTVEHVHVYKGGQAVVGNVQHAGGREEIKK